MKPVLVSSLVMTAPVFLLIPQTDYLLSTISLSLISLAYLLTTTEWAEEILVYAAVGAATLAVGVQVYASNESTLLQPYGLAAVIMGAALWAIAFVNERKLRSSLYVKPLFNTSLVLTIAAVLLAYSSPLAMAIAGIVFLLMIRSHGGTGWLYPALGSAGCAVYFAFLGRPDETAGLASLAAAFILIALSFIVRRFWQPLCAWCQVKDVPYEIALTNLALLASLIPVGLYVEGLFAHGLWLWPFLGIFYLTMIKTYPNPGWIHVSVASFSWSLYLAATILVGTSTMATLGFAMALAHLWVFVQRRITPAEAGICRALDIQNDKYSAVFGQWSLAAFGLSGIFAVILSLLITTASGLLSTGGEILVDRLNVGNVQGWWLMLATLVLTWLYIVIRWPAADSGRFMMQGRPFLVLVVWWLLAPTSPFAVLHENPVLFYALFSSILALVAITLAVESTKAGISAGTGLYGSTVSIGLCVLAFGATRGSEGWATVVALFAAAAVLSAMIELAGDAMWAYPASSAFAVFCAYMAIQINTVLGTVFSSRLLVLGVAAVIAAFLLMSTATVVARRSNRSQAL